LNKTKIDWCDMSWNPVTGCLNGCEYCYAKKMVERFSKGKAEIYHEGCGCNLWYANKGALYPKKFEPTFYPYRLNEPKEKTAGKKIFVCSMADLFGDWVPGIWIEDVLNACNDAPKHTYLFLTKNPKRYWFDEILERITKNMWLGSSACDSNSFYKAICSLAGIDANTFLSIEPLLSEIDKELLNRIFYMDWVIIGAESGNRKDKVIPKREWIESIVSQCKVGEVPVFMKESLRELMGSDFIQEWPETMKGGSR